MKTEAAIVESPGAPALVQVVEIDDPGPMEVRVEVSACSVCRSDRHEQFGKGLVGFPVVLGHEAAGVVEKVGDDVTTLQTGDHVILSWTPHCGHCAACCDDLPAYCAQMQPSPGTGHLSRDGKRLNSYMGLAGFARHTVVPASAAIKIREDVPLDVVCTIGCGVMTGFGAAVHAARVSRGDSVLVFGCGAVGLAAIQGARIAGARAIVAVDTSTEKLALAQIVGATTTLEAGESAAMMAALENGADVAIEAVGRTSIIVEALAAIRSGGTAITLGLPDLSDQLQVSPFLFLMGRTLRGSVYGDATPATDFPKLVDLYSTSELKLDELVTGRFPLEEVNAALDAIDDPATIRSVVTMAR